MEEHDKEQMFWFLLPVVGRKMYDYLFFRIEVDAPEMFKLDAYWKS